jgi:hypothetical protein
MKQGKRAIRVSMHSDSDLDVMAAVVVLGYLQGKAVEPDTVVVAHHTLILFQGPGGTNVTTITMGDTVRWTNQTAHTLHTSTSGTNYTADENGIQALCPQADPFHLRSISWVNTLIFAISIAFRKT